MPTYERNSGKHTTLPAGSTTSSNWTVDDIKKSDILVFRESASDYIDTVVAPNGFQVGLLDETFLSDLLVTGHITGSGIIYAETGFSGSLQKLVDGTDYLVGGSGVIITNNANGSITIEAGGEGSFSRYKSVVNIGQSYTAGQLVPVSAFAFANESYSHNAIDVFLNGDLLIPGDEAAVNAGDADYWLEDDINEVGQIVFRYNVSSNDELIVTVGGGGGAANIVSHSAGAGLTLQNGQFSVDVDNTTIEYNSNSEIAIKNMPGSLSWGHGIVATGGSLYNGNADNTISVNTVSGSPVTVSASGIGMSTSGVSTLVLDAADELIISQSGTIGKTTVQDVLNLVSAATGAPTSAAYLVATSTSSLSSERVLAAGPGIEITDGGPNGNMSVSALVETARGLELLNGKLAVKVSDIIGFGLTELNDNIIVNTADLAGSGLSVNSSTNELEIDFSQMAAASNTISISAGDGLTSGGTVTIGDASSTVNLDVDTSDIVGRGLNVNNNNLDLWVRGTGGISIVTGSIDTSVIEIDGSSFGSISQVIAGTGLTGGGSTGDITLNVADLTISEFADSALQTSTELGSGFDNSDTSLLTAAAIKTYIDSQNFGVGTGTVTSVGVTAGNLIDVSGSPVTTSGNMTIAVDLSELDTSNSDADGDFFVVVNDANDQRKLTKANIALSGFDNDAGFLTSVSDASESTKGVIEIATDIEAADNTVTDKAIVPSNLSALNVSTFVNDANYLTAVSGVTVNEIEAATLLDSTEAPYTPDDVTIMTSAAVNALIESKGYTTESGDITAVTAGVGLAGGGESGDVTLDLDISGLPASIDDPAHGDMIAYADVDDSNAVKKLSINNLTAFQTGWSNSSAYGIASFNGRLYLKPSDLGTTADVDPENDFLLIEDADGGTTAKKASISEFISSVEGTGLAAASGVLSVDYDGADSIIKSAADGTDITIDSDSDLILLHDADADTVKYVKPSQLTSGTAGVIGEAEDGDYTDGLFSSFTPSTSTGTAIDKINEVLKLLAPSPAPDVNGINTTMPNGMSALLSFGATNTGGSTYIDSGAAAGFTAIDTNQTYSPDVNGSKDERLGIFTTDTTVEGIINWEESIAQYANGTVNYVADSFGNGELGILKLYVNGNLLHSVDLTSFTGAGNPGSGSGSSFGGSNNTSGFYAMSTAKAATSEGGTTFDIFKHRTGKYRVHHDDQREGWNYAQVIHDVGGNKTTNFIEWINDTDTTAITATNTSVSNVVGSDEFVLSGIKYFKTCSFDYATTVNNAHRALHTATPIVFNTQYGSITTATDQNAVPLLTTFPGVAIGEDFTKSIVISASGTFNVSHLPSSGLLNQSSTLSIDVVHPRTSKNEAGLASTTVPNLLMWFPTSSSTEDDLEDFYSETYRQQAGNYAAQADVYTSSAYVTPWDSSIKVDSADAGHNTGLVCYQGSLKAPTNTLLNGDFASITNGPGSNADYSSITSGTRTYYRSFKKTSAGSVRDIRIRLFGSGTIVTHGTDLTSDPSYFKVFVKVPDVTGWMDLATPFQLGDTSDNHGARVHTWNPDISNGGVYSYASFGLLTIEQDDFILVKIEADATWTGHLSKVEMKFGASTGSETSVPDDCSTLDSDQDGINANLSFGNSSSIPNSDPDHPYENVNGAHSGLSTIDFNELYARENNSVGRRGIFDGSVIFTGTVNSGEQGDSNNFVPHVINNGNVGQIKLYVNDVLRQTLDLTGPAGTGAPGSGTDTSMTDNTGFTHISESSNPTWSDGIPDYRYFIRTMNYQVATAHQRSGHNWVQVIHSHGGTDYPTDYVEWVNDPSDPTAYALGFSGQEIDNFTDSNISQLSGISYFNSPSSEVRYRISNLYRNVFSDSNSAIGFKDLGSTLDLTSLEIVGDGITNKTVNTDITSLSNLGTTSADYTLPLDVTGSINHHNTSTALPGPHGNGVTGNISITPTVVHPLKNPSGKDDTPLTKTNFLIWTPSQTAPSNSDSIENFSAEAYRLKDEAFDIATSTTATVDAAIWSSAESLVGNGASTNAGHDTGLCIYNGKLIPPMEAGNGGDFTTGLQGPSGNVDYSSANSVGTRRTYLRKFFKDSIGDATTSITLQMTGKGSLKSEGGNLISPKNQGALGNDDNFYIKVKYIYHSTQSPTTMNTGWLDAGERVNQFTAADGDAISLENNTSSDLNVVWNNSTNSVTIAMPTNRYLSGTDAAEHSYVIIKIEASEQWTGYFSDMRITSFS